MFAFEEEVEEKAKIKVVGVGGGGVNAINNMVSAGLSGVEFIAINTDAQHLKISRAHVKQQIGAAITRGLGAGAKPELGRDAAEEDRDAIIALLEGADMVFVAAGMGGGTGTGASPVIAQISKELGILTVGVVTKPFSWEGKRRAMNAEEGLKELKKNVDTLIAVPNDRIHLVVEKGAPLLACFSEANNVLRQAVQGISDIILKSGHINVDFADVKTIMDGAGKAVIGMGTARGANRAQEAAKKAISNPLIEESSIDGASRILINLTGSPDVSFEEFIAVGTLIHDLAHTDANIINGLVYDMEADDEIRVTIIAAGIEERVEPVKLSQVHTWTPKSRNIPAAVNTSSRFLTKKKMEPSLGIGTSTSVQEGFPEPVVVSAKTDEKLPERPVSHDLTMPPEDMYDIPAYVRRKS